MELEGGCGGLGVGSFLEGLKWYGGRVKESLT
jgi:hypothetical protein